MPFSPQFRPPLTEVFQRDAVGQMILDQLVWRQEPFPAWRWPQKLYQGGRGNIVAYQTHTCTNTLVTVLKTFVEWLQALPEVDNPLSDQHGQESQEHGDVDKLSHVGVTLSNTPQSFPSACALTALWLQQKQGVTVCCLHGPSEKCGSLRSRSLLASLIIACVAGIW